MVKRRVVVMVLTLGLGASAAEPKAEVSAPPADVIRYRQSVMRALGTHFKALNAVANQKVPFTKHAALHARAVADLSQIIGELFPKGTGPGSGETDALGAIWADGKAWATAVDKFRAETDKLAAQASSATDVTTLKAQLETVNDSCASCHKAFRAGK